VANGGEMVRVHPTTPEAAAALPTESLPRGHSSDEVPAPTGKALPPLDACPVDPGRTSKPCTTAPGASPSPGPNSTTPISTPSPPSAPGSSAAVVQLCTAGAARTRLRHRAQCILCSLKGGRPNCMRCGVRDVAAMQILSDGDTPIRGAFQRRICTTVVVAVASRLF